MEQNSIKPPSLMKLSSKLVETWVDGMAGSAPSYHDELSSLCRPEKVGGLGAKIIPNASTSSSADPLERRLLRQMNAIKKKSAENSKKTSPVEENEVDDDDSEPESRIKAFTKKRTQFTAPLQCSSKKFK